MHQQRLPGRCRRSLRHRAPSQRDRLRTTGWLFARNWSSKWWVSRNQLVYLLSIYYHTSLAVISSTSQFTSSRGHLEQPEPQPMSAWSSVTAAAAAGAAAVVDHDDDDSSLILSTCLIRFRCTRLGREREGYRLLSTITLSFRLPAFDFCNAFSLKHN